MSHLEEEISKTVKERLAHIELQAYLFGKVRRSDLTNRFGIKDAAATRDFTKYNELAPKNLRYDLRLRVYVPSDTFKPVFTYSTSRVLSTLSEGFGDGLKDNHAVQVACETPTQLNEPRLSSIALLSRAIANEKVVEITYRSLSSGETRRQVVPFALVDNGLRWHIRAWDRLRSRFTDFVVTRIERPKILESEPVEPHETPDKDVSWNTEITLELVPHPRLIHKETIEKDYGMKEGVKKVVLRAAVAGYVLRRWNVDCSANASLTGDEYQLALKNIRDIDVTVDTMALAPGFKNGPA